jgi:3',5'-nucleoside bisphosphate phosphatase
MKTLLLSFQLVCLLSYSVSGHGTAPKPPEDEARMIRFPDTTEYLTLVLDPHTHSVFSDGHVWPIIRVGEALRDGLDAMAVTEHLEYQPHIEDIPHPDRNHSYEEATSAAKGSSLMVIPGAEITRDAPASHMNAIFIKDANKLYSVPAQETPYTSNEYRDMAKKWPAQNAVQAANDQGAFVFWNHAWWTRDFPTGIPVMSDFHKNNAEKGLLHGMEIANGQYFSEDAFQIALDHKLTLMGVSDVHNLIDWDYEPQKGGHRPVTLVFARERSADSMKEALFAGRTVVWFKNWLIGLETNLQPLLKASLSLEEVSYGNGEILEVSIVNTSDADFHLRNLGPYGIHGHAATFTVPQHSTEKLMLRTGSKVESISLAFEVLNAFVAPNQTTTLTLEAQVH